MTAADQQRPSEKPKPPQELPPGAEQPPAPTKMKRPVQKRTVRGRRRKKKTRSERAGGWLKTELGRLGGVIITPKKTFKELAETPDYFGIVFITIASILTSIGANYVLWATKLRFFDVDLQKYVSPQFPYGYYAISEGFSFGIFYLVRNFLVFYLTSWALHGERDARLLLSVTGFSMGTQLVGRLLQVFIFYSFFPQVDPYYQVSTESSIVLMTASVQQLFIHQEVYASTLEFNESVSKAWQMNPVVKGFSYMTFAVNVWTGIVGAFAVWAATKLSWKRSSLIAGIVIALDAAFSIYSFIQ